MAVDMFLLLDGIEGEATDHDHAKEIDILAWSWGMTQSGSFATSTGTGGGSGKVNVQDISVTKWVDKSSPNLMAKCSSGFHIPSAKLTVRKAGGEQLEYLVIELEDVIISSVSTGGSGGEDRLTENVTLNFARVRSTYNPQASAGSGAGDVVYEWNVQMNEANFVAPA